MGGGGVNDVRCYLQNFANQDDVLRWMMHVFSSNEDDVRQWMMFVFGREGGGLMMFVVAIE